MMAHNIREIASTPVDRASRWALFFQLAFVFLEYFIARFNALCSSGSFWKVIFSRGLRYSAVRFARFIDGKVIVFTFGFRVTNLDHLLKGSFELAESEASARDIRTLSVILCNIRYFNLAKVRSILHRASRIYRYLINLFKCLIDTFTLTRCKGL